MNNPLVSLDVIVLSNTLNDDIYEMNNNCFRSLNESESNYKIHIILIESNKNSSYKYDFDNLEIITPQEKFHFHRFINIGIKNTTANFIAVCNNDLIFHKNWFSEIYRLSESHPDILSFSPIDLKYTYMEKLARTNEDFYIGWEVRKQIAGWCIVFKRELLQLVQPFDERYEFYFSDNDYGFILNRNNIKHALVAKSKVDHLESIVSKKIKNDAGINQFFSFRELEDKNMPLCLAKERYRYILEDERLTKDFLVFYEKWGEPIYLLKVSILIVTNNDESTIDNTIKSAISQTYGNKEIIIVDCDSADKSYEIAKLYESDIVKVYKSDNKNTSSAMNYALGKSTGDIIQFLESGTILSGNKIDDQVTEFNFACDNLTLIYSSYLSFKDTVDNSVYVPDIATPSFHYRKNSIKILEDLFNNKYNFFLSSFIIHRDLLNRVGEWDENLSCGNILEYMTRVVLDARSAYYCKSGLLYHRIHSENSISPDFIRSQFLALKKITDNISTKNNKRSLRKASANLFIKNLPFFRPDNDIYNKAVVEIGKLGFGIKGSYEDRFSSLMKKVKRRLIRN